MALVALLFAHHGVMGEAEPFASIDVAGLSIVERQIRLARRAGAERVIVFTERMPPGLAAVLARARTQATVIRDTDLIGNLLDDEDSILVIEEGLLADESSVRAVVGYSGRGAVATCIGAPPYPQAERLDASSFWAGISLYTGRFVRQISSDIGEWDLQSTLLRSAVAEAVPRVVVDPAARLMSVRSARDSGIAAADLIDSTSPHRTTWPERYLHPRLERLALDQLLARQVSGPALAFVGVAIGFLAAAFFAIGWPRVALLLMLLLGPLLSISRRLSDVRLEARPPAVIDRLVRWGVEPSWYVALAAYVAQDQGSGAWALAGMIVVMRLASDRQEAFFRALAGHDLSTVEPRLALTGASCSTLPWALVPFALLGTWYAGLIALAIYAGATFLLVQTRSFKHLLNDAPDQE